MNIKKFFTHPSSVYKQNITLNELYDRGYIWDRKMSVAAAGVVMRKGKDIYFMGLDGSIMHNPEGIITKC